MAHDALLVAKKAKYDEFFTRPQDVEAEMDAYLQNDPALFIGRRVMCPCDDPTSAFAQYFRNRFGYLGLRQLICTCRAAHHTRQMSIFDFDGTYTDADTHGKVLIWTRMADGSVDRREGLLAGNGDVFSSEVTALRDQSDMVITNVPFSLGSRFIQWAYSPDRQIALICNLNTITEADTFPMLQHHLLWCGATRPTVFADRDGNDVHMGNTVWLTNIPFIPNDIRQSLHTASYNLVFNEQLKNILINTYGQKASALHYMSYVNIDALDVPTLSSVPSDYDGLLGVPINWLTMSGCTQDYDLVGAGFGRSAEELGIRPLGTDWVKAYHRSGGTGHYTSAMRVPAIITDDGRGVVVYKRLFIRRHVAK